MACRWVKREEILREPYSTVVEPDPKAARKILGARREWPYCPVEAKVLDLQHYKDWGGKNPEVVWYVSCAACIADSNARSLATMHAKLGTKDTADLQKANDTVTANLTAKGMTMGADGHWYLLYGQQFIRVKGAPYTRLWIGGALYVFSKTGEPVKVFE